ncbi:P-loop containing nucleoside triphosphate hydrolase protein [Radiomyces spectabilis]|uniref:P-loop containing nucleoside triphosphate hydrolase protein n=1 Tax=Radiomyces spectabilis TaxID=64574 RepID=UPI00222015EB|nr:P-loop containing nucleoside triphosphate hydrolase protein [Radiomyces spectabilis]KAI8372822.1 P-loop containing nucleoside triphosphate hydrolase protein [Radiomyces spectabilis]
MNHALIHHTKNLLRLRYYNGCRLSACHSARYLSTSMRCGRSAAVTSVEYASRSQKTAPITSKKNLAESARLKATIMETLYKNKQRPIPTANNNVILTNCPHCLNIRKNSFAAYIDLSNGTYNCKTCNSHGRWHEYAKTLQQKVGQQRDRGFQVVSTSDLLKAGEPHFSRPIKEIHEYPNRLLQDPQLMNQLREKHAIHDDVWRLYGVGLADYVDPNARLQAMKEGRTVEPKLCLTYPQTTVACSFDGENDTDVQFRIDTVRVRASPVESAVDQVTFDPPVVNQAGSAGLFGYHMATSDTDTVILTRRELDAMAAYQSTGIPAFALPTMTYQLQESTLPLLERFSKVYVWLDDDVDGQLASERFAHKLGESRCMIVNTRQGAQQGAVNIHGALLEGKNLNEILHSARRIKHDQIVDFGDLREEVYREILNPEQTKGVQSTDLPALNKVLKGHRPGELTILTGPTGAGKTTIISQISLDYCKSGVATLWGSFEIMNKRLAKKMLYQFAGKDLSLAPQEIDVWADQFEQLPLYFLKFFSSTAIKDVLKACSHAVYAYDVRHIILDNLQFMLSQQGRSSLDRWELQDEAIAELRKFATNQDVHITLVVHPRKDPGEQLEINSVFGSAKVTQEADNVIIIQKQNDMGDDVRYLEVKKNRFDGTLGSIPYKFMPESLKIRAYNEEELKQLQKKMERPSSRFSHSTSQRIGRPRY